MERDYEALADAAERGELKPKPNTTKRGAEATAHARKLLLEASGAADLDELTKITLGRPTVGSPTGVSPVIRARVPQALKDRVGALAAREHRKEADIIREAVAAYVSLQDA
ncbi:hypothetical protein [Curtobacterium sp. S6]|uniref:hypothetical protein n=1 Tax=Curtobacterium sp. S6 TaxID=1479623 RepID=UPI0004AAEFB3|nr:hypothetical protein [Curtobacterium sp. S6]